MAGVTRRKDPPRVYVRRRVQWHVRAVRGSRGSLRALMVDRVSRLRGCAPTGWAHGTIYAAQHAASGPSEPHSVWCGTCSLGSCAAALVSWQAHARPAERGRVHTQQPVTV